MGTYVDGYYAFAPVTASDRRGLLYVAAILSLQFGAASVFGRLYIRRRNYGLDDIFLGISLVLAFGQYAAVFVLLRDHVGTEAAGEMPNLAVVRAGARAIVASEMVFIPAVALTKVSVVMFIQRLFSSEHKAARWFLGFMKIVIFLWAVGSMLGLSVGCGSTSTISGDRCPGEALRWKIVATFDAAIEVGFVGISCYLVWPLQMSLPVKLTVVLAFTCRLVVAGFACAHVHYVIEFTLSQSPCLEAITPLVWQQIELGWALLAASIPVLKQFIRGYDTSHGWTNNSRYVSTVEMHDTSKSRQNSALCSPLAIGCVSSPRNGTALIPPALRRACDISSPFPAPAPSTPISTPPGIRLPSGDSLSMQQINNTLATRRTNTPLALHRSMNNIPPSMQFDMGPLRLDCVEYQVKAYSPHRLERIPSEGSSVSDLTSIRCDKQWRVSIS